jgi:predicted small lipoprotein YifL
MKTPIRLLLLLGLITLAGCGQKGDLYQTETAPPPTMEEPDK